MICKLKSLERPYMDFQAKQSPGSVAEWIVPVLGLSTPPPKPRNTKIWHAMESESVQAAKLYAPPDPVISWVGSKLRQLSCF